ncbi:hypothetical protein PR001_g24012 [Phytophthora rubi]|uniref:RxLR effector protein n=1 Tax=Phytophthora rubi TaxID=129364 RepID=A0A6A3IL65_9STRA|nr:hypothetical protein PR001_g24012 [Phytophthora rubi]
MAMKTHFILSLSVSLCTCRGSAPAQGRCCRLLGRQGRHLHVAGRGQAQHGQERLGHMYM